MPLLTDPFVSQLRDLCASHPTRAKWVVVRSHAMGWTLGDRLARTGTDWLNLRWVTPLDLALRMGAPFLVERGIDPSEEGLGPALVMRLLLEQKTGGYFRPLADQPEMAAALWTTLRELRMAGVRAADLTQGAFESAAKHAELQALLRAYESHLQTHRRGDLATVFEEALAHQDWCPIQPADCLLEQPDIVWAPIERKLIDALPGERLSSATVEVPGTKLPRRLRDVGVRTPAAPDRPTHLFHAGGREAEVEEVFRRVLSSGLPLDEIEIACASAEYAPLVWEKAIRYDWPVTIAQGLPVALTRPGRALLAWAEWIEDDFAAGRLRRLLQSGDVRFDRGRLLSPGRAARLLVKAQAAWGRETYGRSLDLLAHNARERARRDDLPEEERRYLSERADQAIALAGWIDDVIAAVPEPDAGGLVSLRDVAAAARSFVDGAAARSSALDNVAASALVDAIGELAILDELRSPVAHALRFVRERVDHARVGADRPRPGHLFVSSLREAGFAGRSRLFAVGLEEGRVFPASYEDSVLLDAERAQIHDSLALSSDRVDEAVHAVRSRLAAASADPAVTVTLSYSCRDLREYRQTYASWLMLEAFRATVGDPAASYQRMHEHLGTPASAVPSADASPLDLSRWWLRSVRDAGGASSETVLSGYESLKRGLDAEAARESVSFTEFDGHVPDAGPVLDPCAQPYVSPTQLEDAASCPFRYFLRRALGVSAIESGERDRDVWLDPLMRGSMLHDLYARLLRRSRKASRRVTRADDADWMRREALDMLDETSRHRPPPSAEVADRERQAFLEDVDLFVHGEEQLDPDRTPVGFEVGFGRPIGEAADGEDVEPLAQAEPVEVDLGGGLRFRLAGRIDRIDRVGANGYEVIDYKTGSYFAPAWKGTFRGGRSLQHALYGLAAIQLLRRVDSQARLLGAEYYFPSARGHQERKRLPAAPVAVVAALLTDLRDVIVGGAFVHAKDTDDCKWCDYGHACGRNAAALAEAKAGDPILIPIQGLAGHA